MAITIPVFTGVRKRALAEEAAAGGAPDAGGSVTSGASSDVGGSFPWLIVFAVLGVALVLGWLFVMAQVNKAKDAASVGDTESTVGSAVDADPSDAANSEGSDGSAGGLVTVNGMTLTRAQADAVFGAADNEPQRKGKRAFR